MKITITQNKRGIAAVLFIYWLILVLWQATGYASHSGIDIVVKIGLILMLSVYYILHCNGNFNNLLLFLLYGCSLIIPFSFESGFSTNTLIFYAYSILIVFLVFVIGSKFRIGSRQYVWLLDGVIIVSVMSALYALFFRTEQITAALGASNAYGNELSSFFASSHEYGMYMGASVIGCLFGLQLCKSKRKKLFYILALIIVIPNLLMTFSRTTIYSTAIFFIFYIFSVKNKKLKAFLLASAFLLVILSLAWSPLSSLLETLFEKGGSGRDYLYSYAFQYYSSYSPLEMLFGAGIEKVRTAFESTLNHGSVHCAYLQILLYFGAVGLIWLISCLAVAFISYMRLRKIDGQWAWNFICLLIWCSCIMLTNTTIVFTSPIDCFFLTMFALIVPKYVCNSIRCGSFGEHKNGN